MVVSDFSDQTYDWSILLHSRKDFQKFFVQIRNVQLHK